MRQASIHSASFVYTHLVHRRCCMLNAIMVEKKKLLHVTNLSVIINLHHAGLWHVEISTQACTYCSSRYIIQWISQQSVLIEHCFNFSNTLTWTAESICNIGLGLHWELLFMICCNECRLSMLKVKKLALFYLPYKDVLSEPNIPSISVNSR